MSRAFDKAQEMVLASMEYVKVLGFRLRRTEVQRDDWKLVAQSHADELIKLRQRVDELKAERDAERKAHDEYKERNRELFHRNQRLTAELAVIKDERDALRAECDDLRRVSPQEASHITPEGKQTAEGAVMPKPGDVVRLVRVPTNDEYPHDSGRWEPNWGGIGDYMRVHYVGSNSNGTRVVRAVFGFEWPLSCVEVVKGVDK